MLALIGRRVLLLVPTMLVLSFAVFMLSSGLRLDRAAEARAGGAEASPEAITAARAQLNLDDPFLSRYWQWLGAAVRIDFGESFTKTMTVNTPEGRVVRGRPVVGEIRLVLPRTASIVGLATVFSLLLGVTVGIAGGVRPGSVLDRISVVFSTLGLAIPNFWIAMMLIALLAISLGWLPAVGYVSMGEGVLEWFKRILMPAVALSLAPAAMIARQMRGALADAMDSTYIRTAWAKGARRSRVVVRHALKNAASAPLTVFGVMLTSLLSGSVIIETLFGINGLGNLTINAVRSSDIPMVQGIVMFFIVVTMILNLLIDIIYAFLDPKLRIT